MKRLLLLVLLLVPAACWGMDRKADDATRDLETCAACAALREEWIECAEIEMQNPPGTGKSPWCGLQTILHERAYYAWPVRPYSGKWMIQCRYWPEPKTRPMKDSAAVIDYLKGVAK